MTNEPIRYMGFNIGPNVGGNDALIGVRVVPAGRDGNKVLGKTLTYREPDSRAAITVRPGEELLFPVGNVKVSIRDIDRENRPEPDGYAGRLDTAHALCLSALHELEDRPDEPYIKTRARVFNALGYAELMFVALNLAIRMIKDIPSESSVSIVLPNTADAIFPALKEI